MSHKNLSIALCVAVALAASGCTTLKGKKTAVEEATTTTQATPTDTTTNTDPNSAETNGLGKGGVNASGLADNTATTGSNNGQNGTNASNGTGKNGQNGGNGEVSMADLLNVRLVHFDYDSSDLSNADYQTLQAHAQYLSQNPTAKVLLAGHADERGTREYNMALGERRANAVQAFLNSNGAKSSQLDTVSYGKEKPSNDGHDEASWAENRRVEITYKAGSPK